MNLRTLVDDVLMRTAAASSSRTNGAVVGLVAPVDVQRIGRERWPEMTVADVMRPVDSLHTVTPDTSAAEAFTTMARDNVNQLPVVSRGWLEGMVSRAHIMQLLQSRSELHA
jgi:CBS domain-containing protein